MPFSEVMLFRMGSFFGWLNVNFTMLSCPPFNVPFNESHSKYFSSF